MESFLNGLKSIALTILKIILVILFLTGIILFYQAFTHSSEFDAFQFLTGLIAFIPSSIGLFFIIVWPMRCKECKKMFAMKKRDKTHIDSQQISVKKEIKNRNRDGEVIGTSEQYIPGVRHYYKTTYVCKYCGAMASRVHSKQQTLD